jgi:hypothetical protein
MGERKRRVPQDGGDCLIRRRAHEWRAARDHLVKHHAEAEGVGARIHLLAPRLLRRHIARRSYHHPDLGAVSGQCRKLRITDGRRGFGQLGQAEVQHLDNAVAAHHYVLRLDVTMRDPGFVRGSERVADLRGNINCVRQFHPFL